MAVAPTHLAQEGRGRRFLRDVLRTKFSAGDVADLDDAVDTARVAGVEWLTILLALMPLLIGILSGQPVDLQTIIALILSLIGK